MEDILEKLKRFCDSDRLYGWDNWAFYQRVLFYYREFQGHSLQILLAESDPFEFLAIFLAGIASGGSIALGNPQWQQREWEQVFSLIQPDRSFGHTIPSIDSPPISSPKIPDSILIPTGGTSGKIRFTIHTYQTLTASVQGFREYFQLDKINSFCILSLYHVSGLMQFLRCFISEGDFIFISYHNLKKERIYLANLDQYFISLVPTQLQFFLETDPDWLTRFRAVLLGGAPAWPALLETARQHRIPLALTYGMTETASQVVTLKPEEFLQGNNSNGRVLPHAKIDINPSDKTLMIEAKSLFQGYYPERERSHPFPTDDIGYFDENNYLYIIGRNSQKIITGGENVYPLEIEISLRETGLIKDVVVIGIADPRWGQAIAAFYVAIDPPLDRSPIQAILKGKLAPYKHPKHWIEVETIPRNPQGKIDRQRLEEIFNNNR
jgi:O-succinylbenzoic acid--CoA ligase